MGEEEERRLGRSDFRICITWIKKSGLEPTYGALIALEEGH